MARSAASRFIRNNGELKAYWKGVKEGKKSSSLQVTLKEGHHAKINTLIAGSALGMSFHFGLARRAADEVRDEETRQYRGQKLELDKVKVELDKKKIELDKKKIDVEIQKLDQVWVGVPT